MIRKRPASSLNEYRIEIILANLGLNLDSINGKVLDIGCGRGAGLVNYLIQNGKEAEGIDPEVNNSEFLMRGYGWQIPRPNNTYDLVVSHFAHFKDGTEVNRQLLLSMSDGDSMAEYFIRAGYQMAETIGDSLRVLKGGRDFVIWPEPRYLMNELGPELTSRRISYRTERLECDPFGFSNLRHVHLMDEYLHRLVITKPK